MARRDGAVLVAAMLASATLSLTLGQDLNFDQRHYHFYLGWSLLAGRLDVDVAPAAVGTYLNPLMHVPTYLGIAYLPPRLFGAALGAVHGVNLFLVYLVALRVTPAVRYRRLLAATAAVMAGVGPAAVGLVGTTFGDNLASIPMLASVLVLAGAVAEADERRAQARPRLRLGPIALSAAIAGAAAGLKITFAFYCVPLAVVALGLALWARQWRLFAVFAAAGVLGFVLAAGYWGGQMWTRFSNPLFPFANEVFHSPYETVSASRDPRWASHGWTDPLVEALHMATGRTEGLQEIGFADVRYLGLLWLGALLLASRALGRRTFAMPVGARVVVLYWLGCYVVWAGGVHYYRYFALGEYLAPVVLLALLSCLLRRGLVWAWLVLVVAVGASTRTGSWHRIGWDASWYGVRFTAPPEPGAAVMVDGGAVSFVLPYFPEGTRFYGVVEGAFTPLREVVRDRLRAHRGPVYRLRVDTRPPAPLAAYGLSETDECQAVQTRETRLLLCRLDRARGLP